MTETEFKSIHEVVKWLNDNVEKDVKGINQEKPTEAAHD